MAAMIAAKTAPPSTAPMTPTAMTPKDEMTRVRSAIPP
jgi:hypothetical protein